MSTLRDELTWAPLEPLRISARRVAEGAYLGGHKSRKRGGGVEFGGHRNYVPGDDLRWLDRHALMRHGRLLIREFEMETDRELRLLIDASASMGFSSERALGEKLRYATLLGAALGYIATKRGDPVALEWLGGLHNPALPRRSGNEGFERLVRALETAEAQGDLHESSEALTYAFAALGHRASPGALVVLFSDFVDFPDAAWERFMALGSRGRTLLAVHIEDPVEANFPFTEPERFVALEGAYAVETDPKLARDRYLRARANVALRLRDALASAGGHFYSAETSADPVAVVRWLLVLLGELKE